MQEQTNLDISDDDIAFIAQMRRKVIKAGLSTEAQSAEGEKDETEMMQLSNAISAYEQQNYPLAFDLLKPFAEQGNAEAQAMLGTLYQLGLGVEVNPDEAMKWYELASGQGNAVASNNLAGMMSDPQQSAHYYALAREQGFIHAPQERSPF